MVVLRVPSQLCISSYSNFFFFPIFLHQSWWNCHHLYLQNSVELDIINANLPILNEIIGSFFHLIPYEVLSLNQRFRRVSLCVLFCSEVFSPEYITCILVYIGDVQFSGRNFSASCYKMISASDYHLFPSANTSFSLSWEFSLHWSHHQPSDFPLDAFLATFKLQGREQLCIWAGGASALSQCPSCRLLFFVLQGHCPNSLYFYCPICKWR